MGGCYRAGRDRYLINSSGEAITSQMEELHEARGEKDAPEGRCPQTRSERMIRNNLSRLNLCDVSRISSLLSLFRRCTDVDDKDAGASSGGEGRVRIYGTENEEHLSMFRRLASELPGAPERLCSFVNGEGEYATHMCRLVRRSLFTS